jgi:O-antigen/teichoic acid export membrane protein
MTGVNFFSGFIKYKLYSIYLGVIGMGIVSQITSSISFLSYLLPLGFPMGLTKEVAQNINVNNDLVIRMIKSILFILLIPCILAMLIVYFYSSQLSLMLFDDSGYAYYLKILSVSIPFLILYSLTEALIKGLSDISLYVKSIIVSSVLSIILLLPIIIFYGTDGAVYGLFINYIIFVVYNFIKLRKNFIFRIPFRDVKFDKAILKDILNIGIAFLIVGAIYQGTILYLKKMTINAYGIEGNGLFQSILNISVFYFGFIFTSLSSYSFPKIAKIKDNIELALEMNNTIRFIVLIMVPLILVLVMFRYYIILLLYTSDFLAADSFFKYQYLGDFFKAVSWVLGIWLIPRSKLFFFVLFDLILNFNLIFIYRYIIDQTDYGITGVSIAYLISYVIHFALNLILARKVLSFKFSEKNLKLMIISVFTIVFMTYASFYSMMVGYLLIVPVGFIWFKLNVDKNEIQESILLVKNYIKAKT